MLERKLVEDAGLPNRDKTLFLTAAATLTVYQQLVRATANPVTGAYAITLPDVARAQGKMMSIQALDADVTNVITVQDDDESEEWTNISLNGAGEGCLLYSDGRRWWPMVSDTTGTGTPTT